MTMEQAFEWHNNGVMDGKKFGTMKITDKGLHVKLPADGSLRLWRYVEVGFAPGTIAVRQIYERHGFSVRRWGTIRLWSARIGNERLTRLAEEHGFRVGDELEASWDAKQGMIIGKVKDGASRLG